MAKEKEAPIEEEETLPTKEEYLSSCATLIQIADMMNPMTKEEKELKKNILRRSYKIIDEVSSRMYDEWFDDREEIES